MSLPLFDFLARSYQTRGIGRNGGDLANAPQHETHTHQTERQPGPTRRRRTQSGRTSTRLFHNNVGHGQFQATNWGCRGSGPGRAGGGIGDLCLEQPPLGTISWKGGRSCGARPRSFRRGARSGEPSFADPNPRTCERSATILRSGWVPEHAVRSIHPACHETAPDMSKGPPK